MLNRILILVMALLAFSCANFGRKGATSLPHSEGMSQSKKESFSENDPKAGKNGVSRA